MRAVVLTLLLLACGKTEPPAMQEIVDKAPALEGPVADYARKVIAAEVAALANDFTQLEALVGDGWSTLGTEIRRDIGTLKRGLQRKDLDLAQARIVKAHVGGRDPIFEVIVELDGRRYGMMFRTALRGTDYQLLTVSSWIMLETQMF